MSNKKKKKMIMNIKKKKNDDEKEEEEEEEEEQQQWKNSNNNGRIVRRPRTNVIDQLMADLLGIESVTPTKDNPETSGTKEDTSNDEHIALIEQQISDFQGEVQCVRNFGKLLVSNTTPQEPRITAPMPPHFPSLESPVPNLFPPQNTLPISTPVMNSHPINPHPTNQAHVNPQYVNPSLMFQNLSNQIPSNTQHVTSPLVQVPINPMQCVSPIYVTQARPSTTLAPIVDPYELLEKEWKSKEEECDTEMRKTILETIVKLEFKKRGNISVPNLILLPNLPTFEMFEDILEDDPVEGIKSLFFTEDLTETLTIWNAEPGDALKNWTSAPSLVRRESS
ncbi:hypothetical protein H5410_027394 [Solanum commersonii]|uniref:Uncharacterized protein n=1 Tax=Solanum commersonii TaxID=4109 RepID=A0A9J5Z4B9_SOLCO|nr:hypothetical protein H5410_027394 [Solanum commersonii]